MRDGWRKEIRSDGNPQDPRSLSLQPHQTRTTMSAEEVTKPTEEESTAVFEPVVKLDQTIEVKTHEEDEDSLFKMLVLSLC